MQHGLREAIKLWLITPREGWQLVAFILGALGVGAVILGLMMSVPPKYRKPIVIAVTFLGGLYFSLEFLVPPLNYYKPPRNPLTDMRPFVANASMVVASFALLLGIWNLFQVHGGAVRKRRPGWYNSAAFFIAFFTIPIVGFLRDWRAGQVCESPARFGPQTPVGMAAAIDSNVFDILFRGFLTSLDAAMFSLVAFYTVSAAYRAFRVRSVEAALMMATAVIIMLALVPVGVAITSGLPQTGFFSIFRLENIGYWLLVSPNMMAQRAIGFGVAVGGLAMGLRIWLSLERGSFFDRQL